MSNIIEKPVTNAYSLNFKPPSTPVATKHLSSDFYTESELIRRTDSFLAKKKMLTKIVPFDDEKAGSKVFINQCEVISEIKFIIQGLVSNSLQSKASVEQKKLMDSAVYENIVDKWPELDREPHFSHGKMENEYYKTEKVNKLSDLNSLEKKAKTELHRERTHFHGAKVNQVNTIKNVTSSKDLSSLNTNRSPDVNCIGKTLQGTMDNESQTTLDDIESSFKKVNSHNDTTRLNKASKFEREQNFRLGPMDNEINKLPNGQNKFNTFTKNTTRLILTNFENARRGTIDNDYKKNKTNNASTFNYNFPRTSPKLDCDQPFSRGTMDKENTTASNTNNQNDCNTLKKKPRPLPKPKVTSKISDAIEKLNYRQTDAPSSSSEQELGDQYEEVNQFSPNSYLTNNGTTQPELIYENLPSNMPDDMKANMSTSDTVSHYLERKPSTSDTVETHYVVMEPSTSDTVESNYLPMEPLRQCLRKRFASDLIPTILRKDSREETDIIMKDRMSLSCDYIDFDEFTDFNFRDKKLVRNLSIPNCFMIGEKPKSMHERGVSGCIFESYDYLYELNPRTVRENVHPFIKKKEKATPIQCVCRDLRKLKKKVKPGIDNSQMLYYSCENMAEDEAHYDSVEIELFDVPGPDDSVFTPHDDSNGTSTEQAVGGHLKRKLTGIFQKKVTQIKQLVVDW